MTKRVEYWDADNLATSTSEREYDRYTLPAVLEPAYDDWERSRKPVNLSLYVDAETGIVVTDVAAYERSLNA